MQIIQDFPNYSIDPLTGDVWNTKTNRKLSQFKVNDYSVVSLFNKNIKQNKKVHKLYSGFENFTVDHINRNKSDNRLCNLRICNQSQNLHNINPLSNNETGYTGIFIKNRQYLSTITINYKTYTKIFDLTPKGLQEAFKHRLVKKIEHGLLY